LGGEFVRSGASWLGEHSAKSHPGRHALRFWGPKGPKSELIDAIVELKRRNPRLGCPRLPSNWPRALVSNWTKTPSGGCWPSTTGGEGGSQDNGPSWLSFLAHVKDSLWSVNLFRVESTLLQTHWVFVVMDVFTRRIIGFGVQVMTVDGPSLCRMFNQAIIGRLRLLRFKGWRPLDWLECLAASRAPQAGCPEPPLSAFAPEGPVSQSRFAGHGCGLAGAARAMAPTLWVSTFASGDQHHRHPGRHDCSCPKPGQRESASRESDDGDHGNAEAGPWGAIYKHVRKGSDFIYPGPAETWVYLDEHPDSIKP
jgi:hypothetical protein